ncbi:MAG: hypothetical protein JRJ85_11240 [Deltaproteobacteria bacterium]|nr:hypothetical protein [Deltaproteobacteria bacterium]
MSDRPCFLRNRCTSVEQIDENTLRSTCRLQDTLTEASVEIIVTLPDLEISGIDGKVRRSDQDACFEPLSFLKKGIGMRIGPGMLKIIKGLITEVTDCKQLGFMVEECCHGVILYFTKKGLRQAPLDKEEARAYYANMVRENIRLYNRCAAFGPGSSLVEGIDPPC